MIMLKVLIKKQFVEFIHTIFGLYRSKGNTIGKIGFIALFLFLYGFLVVTFYGVGHLFVEVLFPLQLQWLYYVYLVIISCFLCIVGSAFIAYSSIYVAKDNDLLLSMPIKKTDIIISRIFGLYFYSLAYEALVVIPMLLAVFINAKITLLSFLCNLILFFLLPLFTLSICCGLGYIIAIFSRKLQGKMKPMIQTILSVLFFGIYMFASTGMNEYINQILLNGVEFANTVKQTPLYVIGQAYQGHIGYLLMIVLFIVIIFYITIMILQKNYIELSTTKSGSKVDKTKKELQVHSLKKALFKKELSMLTSSSTYMINGCLSCIMLLIIPFLFAFSEDVKYLIAFLKSLDVYFVEFMILAVLALVSSMTSVSSVSLSFERSKVWHFKVLPIKASDIFHVKVLVQFVIVAIFAFISWISFQILLPLTWSVMILVFINLILWIYFCAQLGMIINMLLPRVDFINDTAAVKQNFSALISIMLPYFVIGLFGFVYYTMIQEVVVFMIVLIFILLIINIIFYQWIQRKAQKVLNKV